MQTDLRPVNLPLGRSLAHEDGARVSPMALVETLLCATWGSPSLVVGQETHAHNAPVCNSSLVTTQCTGLVDPVHVLPPPGPGHVRGRGRRCHEGVGDECLFSDATN